MRYRDRRDAGRRLVAHMPSLGDGVLVLALPRGGVPVAAEVATALGAELDVLVVRKLGAPGQPELALGALAAGGIEVLNHELIDYLRVSERALARVAARERLELERRERRYRGERPPPRLEGREVVLIDDGLATGATMAAAVAVARAQRPRRLLVAVPVAPTDVCERLATQVDAMVCPLQPVPFMAVGRWYDAFDQTGDAEVLELLENARGKEP